MPGIISDVFQSDSAEESQSSQTTTVEGDGETGLDLSPGVTVGMSGSYQDAEGDTHEWSNETSLGADADLDAAFAVTGTVGTGDTEMFD